MLNFLEYLYCKYYSFQTRVGNGDVASFTSMFIIVLTLMLYWGAMFFIGILFIPNGSLNMEAVAYISMFLFLVVFSFFYFMFLHKGKYKIILDRRAAELKGQKRLGAILFPLLAFFLYNLGWILKMLQNQGRL